MLTQMIADHATSITVAAVPIVAYAWTKVKKLDLMFELGNIKISVNKKESAATTEKSIDERSESKEM